MWKNSVFHLMEIQKRKSKAGAYIHNDALVNIIYSVQGKTLIFIGKKAWCYYRFIKYL